MTRGQRMRAAKAARPELAAFNDAAVSLLSDRHTRLDVLTLFVAGRNVREARAFEDAALVVLDAGDTVPRRAQALVNVATARHVAAVHALLSVLLR